MKNYIYFFGLIISSILFSCKKEHHILPVNPPFKIDSLALVDSASFTIDGKSYVITNGSSGSSEFGNSDVNVKLDSVVNKNTFYYSGNKDSVLYHSKYDVFKDVFKPNDLISGLSVIFIKKYRKDQLVQGLGIQIPANKLELYTPGIYQYAVDYKRESSENGVNIEVHSKNREMSTYNPTLLGHPTTLSKDLQKNSKFEVISLKMLNNGSYLIEARFNAIVVDENEEPSKLENGYLRFIRFVH